MKACKFVSDDKVVLPPLGWKERFAHMNQLIDVVAAGQLPSLFVYGTPGTGKTERTLSRLKSLGMRPGVEFIHVSGNTSAGGLFGILKNNPTQVILFDDCDDAFTAERTGNILKAALNTKKDRVICWPVKNGTEQEQSFVFSGAVIFLSNLTRDDVDDAILSRSNCIEIVVSEEEMSDMMEEVLPKMHPGVSPDRKQEVLDFLNHPAVRNHLRDRGRFDLRTLYKGIAYRQAFSDWQEKLLRFA